MPNGADTPQSGSREPFRVPAWLLALLVAFSLGYSWMSPQVTAPNERTRLYLTMSLLESGTLAVDEQVRRYGKPYDIAKHDGHYFTDKAPGAAVLAVPFVAAYKALGGDDSIERLTLFARAFVMVPFAVLGVMLAWAVMLRVGLSRATANAASLTFALGTSFFHYGAAFYGHALVTTASLAAAYAVCRAIDAASVARGTAWRVLAGMAGGAAFAFEYQAVVVCMAFAAGYLTRREHLSASGVLAPLVGAALPIGLTLAYNAAAFGAPLDTGYGHLIHSQVELHHDEGLFGVRFPQPLPLLGLLLSPSRGLAWCAPLVLVGCAGFRSLWRRSRWLCVYAMTGALGYLLLIGGAEEWYGGWSFGPRLLVPMFGLAVLSGAAGLEDVSRPWLRGALAGYLIAGVAYNVFVSSMFPEIPFEIKAPLPTTAVALAERGSPSPNWGMLWLGLEGLVSLVPLALTTCLAAWHIFASITEGRRHLRSHASAALVALALFTGVVWLYPESKSKRGAQGWVRHVASMRTEAQ